MNDVESEIFRVRIEMKWVWFPPFFFFFLIRKVYDCNNEKNIMIKPEETGAVRFESRKNEWAVLLVYRWCTVVCGNQANLQNGGWIMGCLREESSGWILRSVKSWLLKERSMIKLSHRSLSRERENHKTGMRKLYAVEKPSELSCRG